MNKPTVPNFAVTTPNPSQLDRQRVVAAAAQVFANVLIENCNEGPDLALALNYLRSCVSGGNQSIVSASTKGAGG